AAVTYMEGLVGRDDVEQFVLKPLMYDGFPVRGTPGLLAVHRLLERHVVPVAQVQTARTVREVVDAVLMGDTVLLIDGEETALVLNLRQWAHRTIAEPDMEPVVRGPREGFVENIRTNTSLLRRRIRPPELKMEQHQIGRFTRTDVVVAYLRGLASESLVDEVRSRLTRLD